MNNKIPQRQQISRKQQPLQFIILDTNIIQYSGNMPTSPEFLKYLSDLMKRGFGLAISDISIYEILRGATTSQEEKIFRTLGIFNTYYISQQVIIASARLYTLYRDEKIQVANIDDGDLIIAATSVLTGSLILTRNRRDFPFPFFEEAEIRTIYFAKSLGHTGEHTICLLRPNINLVVRKFLQKQ